MVPHVDRRRRRNACVADGHTNPARWPLCRQAGLVAADRLGQQVAVGQPQLAAGDDDAVRAVDRERHGRIEVVGHHRQVPHLVQLQDQPQHGGRGVRLLLESLSGDVVDIGSRTHGDDPEARGRVAILQELVDDPV
jgi:hypothetical protein